MKTLWLEAHVTMDIQLSGQYIQQLPKELAVFTTIQFIDSIDPVLKQLKEAGIKVHLCKGKHTQRPGQILGCEYLDYPAPAFLYIGDGVFHPQAIAIKNEKPIFCYNPYSKEMTTFDRADIERQVKLHKVAIVKFLSAQHIGVIVSTKPGQQFMKKSLALKEKMEAKGKNVYVMLSNTVDFMQMNNFSFVDVWVNSACPRIGIDDKNKVDKPMVNLEDIWPYVDSQEL